jgi:hypothetical protein
VPHEFLFCTQPVVDVLAASTAAGSANSASIPIEWPALQHRLADYAALGICAAD